MITNDRLIRELSQVTTTIELNTATTATTTPMTVFASLAFRCCLLLVMMMIRFILAIVIIIVIIIMIVMMVVVIVAVILVVVGAPWACCCRCWVILPFLQCTGKVIGLHGVSLRFSVNVLIVGLCGACSFVFWAQKIQQRLCDLGAKTA